MRKNLLRVGVAIVLVLANVATVLAAPPNPGTGESFGAVQNTGGVSATAQAVYYNPNGSVAATKDLTIAPKATQGIAPRLLDGTSQALPSGWSGSVVVSADQDIVAVSYINWTGAAAAFGADLKTSAMFGGINAPAQSVFFPSVSNRDNEATELSIQNAGAAAAPAYMSFFDRSGSPVGTPSLATASIPMNAQVTVKLVSLGLPADFLGSVSVTSTQPIAGVAIVHWTAANGSFAYAAEPSTGGTTALYFPKVTRRSNNFGASATDCAANGGWYDDSGVVAQNMVATAADVGVSFYDRTGALITRFSDTIPASSSHGYNTRYLGNAPATNMQALGCNFLGSVVVTSTQPIVGIIKDDYAALQQAGGYNGVAGTKGANSMYFPYFYHTANDYATAPTASNPWAQYTGLIVQNVSGSAVQVYLNVLSRDGVTVIASIPDPTTIGPGASHGFNARYGGNLDASTFSSLAWSFGGGAYITATGQIVGVASTWNTFGGDVNEALGFPR